MNIQYSFASNLAWESSYNGLLISVMMNTSRHIFPAIMRSTESDKW